MFVQPWTGVDSHELLARKLATRPGFAWLDSDGSDGVDGRYSFLTSDPVELRQAADRLQWTELLDELGSLTREVATEDLQPLAAEWPASCVVPRFIGYLSYDGRACFGRYEALWVFDHVAQRAFLVGDDAQACARLQSRLNQPATALSARVGRVIASDPAQHARAIERALLHIAAGDIYQVNLARHFVASFAGDRLTVALAMRAQSPVPLGFCYDDGQQLVIARTMERFLRWQRAERTLVTRPIKGTLERHGRDRDEALALVNDPKEHAEHAMIVDLMRNDLGRVAQIGSVRPDPVMAVEHYAKLSHLVSTVSCVTRPEVTIGALIAATFPPGSVTGTPKRRATQIIAELETERRGVYTGAVGYVDRAGGLSLAVAIRTATVSDGQARYFAGGGIVEASQIERELAETELKARVFLDAIDVLRGQSDDTASGASNGGLSATPLLR